MKYLLATAALAISLIAQAEDPPEILGPDLPGTIGSVAADPPQTADSVFHHLRRDPNAFTLVSETSGLSFHKPMFMMPVSWSPSYNGNHTEVLYQISLKQRLFNRNIFFAYTQKSYWEVYDGANSRPFRETDYNPELFYRWKPEWASAPGLGFDLGIDHQSNGKDLPASRSWNRLIGAVYYETGLQLVHLRLWYRAPEDRNRPPTDPKRDDNPDILQYMGYGELRIQRKLFNDHKHMVALMMRGNPKTGKGAVEFSYSVPFSDFAFWNVYVWNGYGESLMDYNRSITRVGVGFMLSR